MNDPGSVEEIFGFGLDKDGKLILENADAIIETGIKDLPNVIILPTFGYEVIK